MLERAVVYAVVVGAKIVGVSFALLVVVEAKMIAASSLVAASPEARESSEEDIATDKTQHLWNSDVL